LNDISTALAILLAAGFPSACRENSTSETKRDPAVLDGMELTAARRVGLESATDAMERGDLNRLKMLSTWVRSRAQVVLFEPQDVEALDHAIACLENTSTRSAELTALAQIKSGALSRPAREACEREPQ
jgi:hypothetical protein